MARHARRPAVRPVFRWMRISGALFPVAACSLLLESTDATFRNDGIERTDGAGGLADAADVSMSAIPAEDARPDARSDARDAAADADAVADADADTEVDATPRERQYVGFYPNFPGVDPTDPTAQARATEAKINAISFPVVWSDIFYSTNPNCDPTCDDPSVPCAGERCQLCTSLEPDRCYFKPSKLPVCRQLGWDDLKCYVARGVTTWIAAVLPANRAFLLNLFLKVGRDDYRIGPTFLTELQQSPQDFYQNPIVWSRFQEFYDHIYETIRLIDQSPSGGLGSRWMVAVTAPNACGVDGLWDAQTALFRQARAYIEDPAVHPDGPIVVGSRVPFISTGCDGLWSVATETFSPEKDAITDLLAASDFLGFNYQPMDRDAFWMALRPDRVADDVARMIQFRDDLPIGDEGEKPKIVLTDVTYSSDDLLHNQPVDSPYSSFAGDTAQNILAQNLFDAFAANPDIFAGRFWRNLFDIGVGSFDCDILAILEGFPISPYARNAFCASGLLYPYSKTEPIAAKAVWTTFRERSSLLTAR